MWSKTAYSKSVKDEEFQTHQQITALTRTSNTKIGCIPLLFNFVVQGNQVKGAKNMVFGIILASA